MIFIELDDNGIVQRAIMAESIEWCVINLGGAWMQIDNPYVCGIGWTWDGKRFMPPETKEGDTK